MRILFFRLSTSAIFLFLSLAAVLPAPRAQEHSTVPGELVVDFTNEESRSISVRVGSNNGITADLNFAVLDSTGLHIAQFYPHEILVDRFWSGPLEPDDFMRIRPGSPVVRIRLVPERAEHLRRLFLARLAKLEEERRQRRLHVLDEEKTDLKEQINELEVDLYHLNSDLKSLQEDLNREKRSVNRQVDDLQEQISDLRNERSELNEDREDLLERRDTLLKRSDPPQDRISDINEDISNLDRDIGRINIEIDDIREDIRDLQDETRSIQEEIGLVRDEQRELDSERRELERGLKEVETEMEILKAE